MFGLCWQFSDKIQPAPGLDLEIWGTARIYRTLVADHPTGVDDPESSSYWNLLGHVIPSLRADAGDMFTRALKLGRQRRAPGLCYSHRAPRQVRLYSPKCATVMRYSQQGRVKPSS
jgi:hypothetical protein